MNISNGLQPRTQQILQTLDLLQALKAKRNCMSEVSICASDLTGQPAKIKIGPEITSPKENGRALREEPIFGIQGNQTQHALYNGVSDPT
ncbi:hypothetical protein MMC22_000253, partial [Lobaria immixta]|nr:hypothetical protein [Lobaria immixta]